MNFLLVSNIILVFLFALSQYDVVTGSSIKLYRRNIRTIGENILIDRREDGVVEPTEKKRTNKKKGKNTKNTRRPKTYIKYAAG